jgi:uncharacterized membrane protein
MVLVIIFAAVYLHERPSLGGWLGIRLVATGLANVAWNS